MKDRIVWLMIMVMCLAGGAGAATILLCSDEPVSGGRDDTLIAWLESLGYTVDTSAMNEVYRDGNGGPPTGGNALQTSAEAADLVFFWTSSGQINDAGSPKAWNELPTPFLLNGNAAMIRGINDADRLGWATGDDTGNDDDNYWRRWEGSKDVEDLVMFDWTGSTVLDGGTPIAPKSVGRFEDWPDDTWEGPVGMTDNLGDGYELAGGTRIYATYQDDDKGVWVTFPAGTDFDAGQDPPIGYRYGVAGDVRVFFGHWGYDIDNAGPGGIATQWEHYLTDLYKDKLTTVMEELTGGGDPNKNPPPTCNAGPDQGLYTDELPAQLDGSASDAGPENPLAPGYPGGIVSSYWFQQSGPGAATFTPADGIDDLAPTVMFSAPGDYELVLQVYDSEGQDANDIVTIIVRSRTGGLIGHWPLDGDAVDASVNSNDGVFAMEYAGYPKWSADAAIGTGSIELADPNTTDPNAPHIDLGVATALDLTTEHFTISGWIKSTQVKGSGDLGKGAIFANGADSGGGHRYCLITNEGDANRTTFIIDDNGDIGNKFTTQDDGPDIDGFWHFIVGVREWNEIRIYRDGVLENTNSGVQMNYSLVGVSAWNSRIGAIANADNGSIYKGFEGLIDEVKVHDYALNETEILALTAQGPIVAVVGAGSDFSINWKPTSLPEALSGSIIDNGISPMTSGMWVTTAGPDDGLGDFIRASFTDATDPATTVTFTVPGVYELTLNVADPHAVDPVDNPGGIIEDTVVVTVIAPTCADVIADGLLLSLDIDEDCYVGLSDLVLLFMGADGYLNCNDPLDASCPWAF